MSRARLPVVPNQKLTLGWLTVILTAIILLIGLVAVYNASVAEGLREYGNKYHFVTQQTKWLILGVVIALVTSQIPLSTIKKASPMVFIVALVLMVLVLIPGVGNKVGGARRWINFPGFSLQPTEGLKLALVLYLASFLEKKNQFKAFIFITTLVIALTMLQPDLGTAIILGCISFLLYYLSGAPLQKLTIVLAAAALIGSVLILGSPYRRARLTTFLDPTTDPLGTSYHINQVLLALGSGGVKGVGLGRSRQKFAYLPEATTDSIFAVIGEETGFIGCLVVAGLLMSLTMVGFQIAQNSRERYHQLLAAGVASWLAAQTLLNLGAMVALVPLTGIPLPFVSYGGSALVATLAGIGLLVNIAKTEKI